MLKPTFCPWTGSGRSRTATPSTAVLPSLPVTHWRSCMPRQVLAVSPRHGLFVPGRPSLSGLFNPCLACICRCWIPSRCHQSPLSPHGTRFPPMCIWPYTVHTKSLRKDPSPCLSSMTWCHAVIPITSTFIRMVPTSPLRPPLLQRFMSLPGPLAGLGGCLDTTRCLQLSYLVYWAPLNL